MTGAAAGRSPRVVVIGAGVVGAALADELTERGYTNVTVVDQGSLPVTGGSSSHAPGLVFQTNPSLTMARFAAATVAKFTVLGCFNPVGGIELATTPERLDDLARRWGWATSWGIDARLIDAGECAARHPLVDASRVLGGLYVGSDGLANARDAVARQLDRAASRGATLLGGRQVTAIEQRGGRVRAVATTAGTIPADIIVSATGFWGPRTGEMVGLPSPLLPMAHQYARTAELDLMRAASPGGAEATTPMLRHQEQDLYVRQHHHGVGIGSYRHRPLPVDLDDLPANDLPSVLAFTPDDFAPSWDDAVELLPSLAGTAITEGINGVFSFTADGMPLMGRHPSLDGYWVAEAVWVTHSVGVAQAMAEWIIDGEPSIDVSCCDIDRFDEVERRDDVVRARASQQFVEVYDIIHPLDPPGAPRDLHVTPFRARHDELGAVFGVQGGWERPLWFGANEPDAEEIDHPERDPWAMRNWSPAVVAETIATRERVALFDMTPLTRLDVTGEGAAPFLSSIAARKVDSEPGRVVYTLVLTGSGGVATDMTVARLGPDRFRVGVNGALDAGRLRRAAPDGVTVTDVTATIAGLGLWGPAARDVLAAVTSDDVSNDGFGYFRCRPIALDTAGGQCDALAMRVSYAGELGWELYADADEALGVWDALWAAGEPHGIVAAGRRALDALRIEKGYRAMGADVRAEHDPFSAGLGFAVGKDAVGRDAAEARQVDATHRLVPIVFDVVTDLVDGAEPVLVGDVTVGYVTSAAYSPTIHASVALAWIRADRADPGTAVDVVRFGRRLPATVATDPLVDPEGKRVRA